MPEVTDCAGRVTSEVGFKLFNVSFVGYIVLTFLSKIETTIGKGVECVKYEPISLSV